MIERLIESRIEREMQYTPVVALLGARQVGKTTLSLEIGRKKNALYLDLESPKDLVKLTDAEAFLSRYQGQLVILDEIQRVPGIFSVLRGLVDAYRRAGQKGEQFLVLGSASMDLLRQSSESLAGRIGYIEMSGFNRIEVNTDTKMSIERLWLRGGFPESYLADNDLQASDWLENTIRTYVERDIPQVGFRIPGVRLLRLWTMLAHLHGQNINASALGNGLDIDSKTVSHYIDILENLFLVRRLQPWHENVKKRLIKSPRVYIRDNGILHRLLDIIRYDSLLSNPILGNSWEGFVIENIASILPSTAKLFFYRTASGEEIDLLIRFSSDTVWAIEIKKSTVPVLSKGFYQACEDVRPTKKFVVYGGDDQFSLGQDTTVISLKAIMEAIIALYN